MFYNSYCLLKCKKDRRDAGPTKPSQANRFTGLTNDSCMSVNSYGTTGRRIWPDAELRRYRGLFRSTGQTNPDQTIACSANDAHIGMGAEKVTIYRGDFRTGNDIIGRLGIDWHPYGSSLHNQINVMFPSPDFQDTVKFRLLAVEKS